MSKTEIARYLFFPLYEWSKDNDAEWQDYFKIVRFTEGTRLRVNINDHIGYQIAAKGHWDYASLSLVDYFESSNILFIDIGCNIGAVSIPVSIKIGSRNRVISVEANPVTAREFTFNKEINNCNNIEFFNLALVSPENLNKKLVIHSPKGNSAAASMLNNWNTQKSIIEEFYVEPSTLDSLMSREVSLDGFSNFETIVKIDVEGFEEEVFKGAVNTIDKLRPIILFEHVPEYLSEDSRDNYYWENLPSYEVFTIGENFTLSRMNPVIRQENCLAIPWEKMDYFSKPVLR